MITKTEVVVETATSPTVKVGDMVKGFRVDRKFFADYIRQNYTSIGDGTCLSKNKKVDLFADNSGNIYGVSTVLPYRYFELSHEYREAS